MPTAIGEFIRQNPERARSLEQMTMYVPYLFADGMSLVQSQAALTVSRLASLLVSVSLHDHPTIQQHVNQLQRELSAVSSGAITSTNTNNKANGAVAVVSNGSSSPDGLNNDRPTPSPAAEGSSNSGGGGGQSVYDALRLDGSQGPNLDGVGAAATPPPEELAATGDSSNIVNLTEKYTDAKSRALIAHYKRNVAAEMGLVFLNEIDVLLELMVRSQSFHHVLASRSLGKCFDRNAMTSSTATPHTTSPPPNPHHHKIVSHAASSSSPSAPHTPASGGGGGGGGATNTIVDKLIAFMSGKHAIPSEAQINARSRRAGWVLCFTISLMKTILRLFMHRSQLSGMLKSIVAQLYNVMAKWGRGVRRMVTNNSNKKNNSEASGNSDKKKKSSSEGCGDDDDFDLDGYLSPSAGALAASLRRRAPSAGLTIPRVAVNTTHNTSISDAFLGEDAAAAAAAETGDEDENTATSSSPPSSSSVYIYSFVEYLATIVDSFHAAKPLLWVMISYLTRRNPSAASSLTIAALSERLRGVRPPNNVGKLLWTRVEQESLGTTPATSSAAPLAAIFTAVGVPRLYTPSWAGWCTMTAMELCALAASLWIKAQRRPTIVISANTATPPMPLIQPSEEDDENRDKEEEADCSADAADRIVFLGSDSLTEDHARVATSMSNLFFSATLQDPFFTTVLREAVLSYAVNGGLASIPIVGGIIGAQTMMYLMRRDSSFMASNFK